MKRKGSAVWTGDLQNGQGTVSTQSGVLKDQKYGFKTRFEDAPGTNPEELTQTFAPYFETEHLFEVSETFTSRAYPQLEGVFRLQRTER